MAHPGDSLMTGLLLQLDQVKKNVVIVDTAVSPAAQSCARPGDVLTTIDGTQLHKQSKWKRFPKIAYLLQDSMRPPDVTVRTLVRSAGLSSPHVPDRLSSSLPREVRTLSGGERRLLEVAIVLGLERDYVLLDEPFTGVEPLLIDAIGRRIEQAATNGTGILLTDHYHRHVTPLADDAYVLWHKQCVPLGGDAPLHDQLVEMGYLRADAAARS